MGWRMCWISFGRQRLSWSGAGLGVMLKQREMLVMLFFFSSRRRHTRSLRDWSSDVCSSDLQKVTRRQVLKGAAAAGALGALGGPAVVLADKDKDKDDDEGERIRWDIVNIFPLADCVKQIGRASCRERTLTSVV